MRIWKNMKMCCALVGGLVLLLASYGNAASVIDAPHNETNDIACGQCHTYSLWWMFSPATASNATPYASITDGVCNKCHGPGGPEFSKMGHSSATMGHDYPYLDPIDPVNNPGIPLSWSRSCVDCHDPHLQGQLAHISENPVFNDGTLAGGVFLAEGTMSNIPATATGGLMTFDFSSLIAKEGWDDTALWSKKSGNDDRGLILVLGYGASEKTYEITAASTTAETIIPTVLPADGEGTITVQVGSDPIPGGPIGQGSYEGTNFGIIYGQLIKSSIDTRNTLADYLDLDGDGVDTILPRVVKFFDTKNNGFVDTEFSTEEPLSTGICQVCHYQALHYNENGLENVTGDALSHYVGMQCTVCHAIKKAFSPSYSDHNLFINYVSIAGSSSCGGGATGCHMPIVKEPDVLAGIVADVHQRDCFLCHDGTPPNMFTTFSGAKIVGDNNPPNWPTPDVEDDAIAPGVGNCWDCHGDYFDGHMNITDHSLNTITNLPQVGGNVNCTTSCHFHNSDFITGVHDSLAVGGSAPCDKCHSSDGVLKTVGELSAEPLAQAVTPGDCTGCHTSIASDPVSFHSNAADHSTNYLSGGVDVQVGFNGEDFAPNGSCFDPDTNDTQGCHDASSASTGVHSEYPNGELVNPCGYCHVASDNNWALRDVAAINGPGVCSTCHTEGNDDDHWPHAPVLTMDDTEIAYTVNDPIIPLEPPVQTTTVEDIDSDWDGGSLTIQITDGADAGDQLSIISESPVPYLYGPAIFDNTSGAGGLFIGTASATSVMGSDTLTVRLTNETTNGHVQEIVRHIGFSAANIGTGPRTVTFTVTDASVNSGNFGSGFIGTRIVNVQ